MPGAEAKLLNRLCVQWSSFSLLHGFLVFSMLLLPTPSVPYSFFRSFTNLLFHLPFFLPYIVFAFLPYLPVYSIFLYLFPLSHFFFFYTRICSSFLLTSFFKALLHVLFFSHRLSFFSLFLVILLPFLFLFCLCFHT